MTIVGTRPEIIRLSATIKRLDASLDHTLVHTGQNYDHNLNQVFFKDLGLNEPDHYLGITTDTLGQAIGTLMIKVEEVLKSEKPDAVLILGDTNSALSAIIAKRMRIPVFHMEAGNRCFDMNVPEETNRRIVDHCADFNLVYTEHARRNLLAEGLPTRRIFLTGSPMREVLENQKTKIEKSGILKTLKLKKKGYILVSAHREETVDNKTQLVTLTDTLDAVHAHFKLPVIVSTHPRTRKQLSTHGIEPSGDIRFLDPFGFNDYNHLQLNSYCVVSDSGTISEEAAILGFPAVCIRNAIERPEALDTGSIILCGLEKDAAISGIARMRQNYDTDNIPACPEDYQITDTSLRVLNLLTGLSSLNSHWHGLNKA